MVVCCACGEQIPINDLKDDLRARECLSGRVFRIPRDEAAAREKVNWMCSPCVRTHGFSRLLQEVL